MRTPGQIARLHKNVDRFSEVFARHLKDCVETMPEEYSFPVVTVPIVVEKMRSAFLKGSYNHDGPAIKRTCKELGIKHTRKAIEAFFENG